MSTPEKTSVPNPPKDAAPKPAADTSVGAGETVTDPDSPAAPKTGSDKPPKKKPGRPKGSKTKAKATGDSAPRESGLRKQLVGILTGPALAFEAVGEQWPADHVSSQARNLAREIDNYAKRNPAFKERLERFLEGGQTTALIVAAAMYVAPVGIYFGMIPAPPRVREMLAIPERRTIAGPEIPPEMKEAMEADAKARGFVDPFGEADLDAFMRAANEAAAAAVRGPGG